MHGGSVAPVLHIPEIGIELRSGSSLPGKGFQSSPPHTQKLKIAFTRTTREPALLLSVSELDASAFPGRSLRWSSRAAATWEDAVLADLPWVPREAWPLPGVCVEGDAHWTVGSYCSAHVPAG